MNYRMVAYCIGRIMMAVAATMAVPMALSVFYGDGQFTAYLIPIVISLAIGLAVSVRPPKNKGLFSREGMVIVALGWIIISAVGGLPFYISGEIPSFIDCFFETVSGFTTTGSTILRDVEAMSKSLLFWRSFTHWLGGMGVLAFSMAIFSSKDTRATYMIRAEMPGPTVGKLASKWQFSVRILYGIYIGLTILEIIMLLFGGMPLFDSIVHTFGSAGTGGFGIKNASIGYYNSAYIDYVIGIFMALFGMNFNVFYLLLIRKFSKIGENDELKWYVGIMLGSAVIIALNIMPIYDGFGQSFRYSFFQVSSIMTTTGYATADFAMWPLLSQIILVMLMIIGASAGSTGGGIKVIRFVVLAKSALHSIKRNISPRSVQSVKADGQRVQNEVLNSILIYFVLYMIIMGVSIILVSFDNKDFATTVTSVIATINNIGPGLGKVGPTGNFADFSALSKLAMSFDMLVGRLEIYPILALFLPYMWKKA